MIDVREATNFCESDIATCRQLKTSEQREKIE